VVRVRLVLFQKEYLTGSYKKWGHEIENRIGIRKHIYTLDGDSGQLFIRFQAVSTYKYLLVDEDRTCDLIKRIKVTQTRQHN
jgi:hypothetical protein